VVVAALQQLVLELLEVLAAVAVTDLLVVQVIHQAQAQAKETLVALAVLTVAAGAVVLVQ
jgi:hypothetical protein